MYNASKSTNIYKVRKGQLTLINLVGQLSDIDLESTLDFCENLFVLRRRNKGDTETFGAKSTGTTNTMKVRISFGRYIIVNGNIDALDINSSSKDVSTNSNSLLKCLELFVSSNSRIC